MFGYYAPTLLVALYIPVALLGAWGIGHLLGVRVLAERVFVGLGVNAAVLVPVTALAPEFVTTVSTSITILGLSRGAAVIAPPAFRFLKTLSGTRLSTAIRKLFGQLTSVTANISSRELFPGFLALILTLWLIPNLYLFESHDLLYFGWLPALVSSGNLAVDFAVPLKMGISNNLASLSLVPLALPSETHGFTDFVFFRAIFVFFFVFFIFRRVMTASSHKSLWRMLSGIGAGLLIWGSEWVYVLLISSFFPAIGLALLALRRVEGRKDANGVFLILVLIAVSKAPIIAVSLAGLIYLSVSRKWKPDFLTYISSGAIVLSSLLTWATAPRGSAASADSIQYTFLGLGFREGSIENGLEWRLYEWAASFMGLPGWVVDFPGQLWQFGLESNEPTVWVLASSISILWVVAKYFVAFGLMRYHSYKGKRWDVDPLDVWAIGAFFSFFIVRNGDQTLYLDHQAHAFILLAVPASVLFLSWVVSDRASLLNGVAVRKIVVLALVVSGVLSSTSPLLVRQQSESAVMLSQAYHEQRQLAPADKGLSSQDPSYGRMQVISAIIGTKLNYDPASRGSSQVDDFLVR